MRFGAADSSDEDEIASLDFSYSSDNSFSLSPSKHDARSSFGKNILAALDSSDSEAALDSEDEVEMLGLDDGWDVIPKKKEEKWRESTRAKSVTPSIKSKGKAKIAIPTITWATPNKSSSQGKARIEELLREEPSDYDRWLKSTDQAAWRDGQKAAQERRGEIRVIASNARARLRGKEDDRVAREAEEMRRLLEGMAIKQNKEEEETARKFAEREKKLWADIDAAIKEVEKKQAELAAAAQAAARKQKEEEAARIAAAEKQAVAQKAEAERKTKEQAEKERLAREAKEAEDRRVAAEKEEQEARSKAAAEKGKAGGEWRKWVEKQKWMKSEVIEPVKADGEVKRGLRQGMRLITRGLGQVVNTQESIVRVTNDLNAILIQQLPSPPTSESPTILNAELPKAYAYLLSHLSKALVKQAESEVNAKADAAFPLARIVIGLLLRGHAALGEVVFARFVKKCPWVIPFFPARQPNQAREEYEKSTGRGSDESLAEYISRMAGISTLYFAILQTPLSSIIPTTSISPPSPTQLETLIIQPLRLPQAWTWLALALKDPMPASPPIAHLVSAWIEIVAHEVVRVYGRGQVEKIWFAIESEGLQGGKIKGDSEAARQRLSLVIGEARREGGAKVPTGRVWE
ncbi:hypothetical protein CI109_106095 [Kwoniella shandongensis]|uniref:mRNA export factor GLE1 n=1 Tax=Kwoniella shandongensis TaxID=1734106 RepID=A0A5M6BQX0_9TREE|nr:uncharacterized protein CI109_006367 [Kwoniella shandongensis]KAA5525296.1 hypothetical protein CI109_006367 [Kwoniella shandongensis]